jgi:hypothetical protein
VTNVPDPANRTRIEKVAADNGFDQEHPPDGLWLAFSSTQAPLRIWLTSQGDGVFVVGMSLAHVAAALTEHGAPMEMPLPAGAVAAWSTGSIADLHRLVRDAFRLSRTLPDELLNAFKKATAGLPRATEIERLEVQRIGQDLFRNGLLEYWQGRCAITGLAVPVLLRAGHIKPWAACETDAERLDIFNGLLLAPNLDAAFDCGFITVADHGQVMVSAQLGPADCRALGLGAALRVNDLKPGHHAYLAFHREKVFRGGARSHTFDRYIGIDYSGAETPKSRLPGIRVYVATPGAAPTEVRPRRGHWSRRELAEWLCARLAEPTKTIVGIDHCFSFPKAYFDAHGLALDWEQFLDDFQVHWPTDGDDVYVDFVREGVEGHGAARQGNARWRRITEVRAGGAKSAFHFDVPGSVAKSTHSGLPWLRHIRKRCGTTVHFWPFDGWAVPAGRSAIVEVYPSLWRGRYPLNGVTEDQRDAYGAAAWLQEADREGTLASYFEPALTDADRATATAEGWILGVH